MSNEKNNNNDLIFISIASFCDSLLENTIENMIQQAEFPENLVFGICFQDSIENIKLFGEKYASKENFKIISVPSEESQGCCWARAQIQQLISHETYFFQCDSHHVYIKNWDSHCIHMYNQCVSQSKHSKVVLSTYATPCNLPDFYVTHDDAPYYMRTEKFYNFPKVRYVPEKLKSSDVINGKPILWHTISAHFLFTKTSWVHDVPYDPELYFDGEEDTLALRSFTNGYDIYYPYRVVSYHFYTRSGHTRHSDVDKQWHKIDTYAKQRLHKIINGQIKGKFGLGNERTLEDYKSLSKLDYINMVTLIPEIFVYGTSTFVKTGLDWAENNKYKFKECENNQFHILLYDSSREIYIKLGKDIKYIKCSKDLQTWNDIFTPPKVSSLVELKYGERVFSKINNTKWIENSVNSTQSWSFTQHAVNSECYTVYDESRKMTLRLYKDALLIEGLWPPNKKFAILYGSNKIPVIKTSNNNSVVSIDSFTIGYSSFEVKNEIWIEKCSNKNSLTKYKCISSANEDYILQNVANNVHYIKISKSFDNYSISTDNQQWIQIYSCVIQKPLAQNDASVSYSCPRKSTTVVVSHGNSSELFAEEALKNHKRYAKKYGMSYFYVDTSTDSLKDTLNSLSDTHSCLLTLSTRTIITKFIQPKFFIKHQKYNAFASSLDNNLVDNNIVIYKNVNTEKSVFQLSENKISTSDCDKYNIKLLLSDTFACNYSNHNKTRFSLVLHIMNNPQEIMNLFSQWNQKLRIS